MMTKSLVTVHAAKTNLSKLIAQALAGDEIVIAKGDEPVVRLVPIQERQTKRKFGALKGKLVVPDSFFEPLTEDQLAAWE